MQRERRRGREAEKEAEADPERGICMRICICGKRERERERGDAHTDVHAFVFGLASTSLNNADMATMHTGTHVFDKGTNA